MKRIRFRLLFFRLFFTASSPKFDACLSNCSLRFARLFFVMKSFSRILLSALLLGAPALAQTKTPAPKSAPKTPGNSTIRGDLSYRPNGGVRLDANAAGPARVTLPQLDVSARSVALDDAPNISQVRAVGSVNFKLDLAPRAGAAPARIEATCNSATYFVRERKLVLKGNLKGFYQVAGGPKSTLGGEVATFTNPGGNLLAELTGGVSLVVPAETLGRPDQIGALTITAQRAQINQSEGTATFAGNARAISTGGANAFDVAAPRFTLTRLAGGTISTLVATGRTLVKLDLPPDPTPIATPGATVPTAPVSPDVPQKISVGKPTRVEVASDGAIIERATSTATFAGNVKGFYRLSAAGAAPQNYDFAGSRAVIRFVQPADAKAGMLAGLNVDVSDAVVGGPSFNLGF